MTSKLDSKELYANRYIQLPPMTLKEWQKYINLSKASMYDRLKDGDFTLCPQLKKEDFKL